MLYKYIKENTKNHIDWIKNEVSTREEQSLLYRLILVTGLPDPVDIQNMFYNVKITYL